MSDFNPDLFLTTEIEGGFDEIEPLLPESEHISTIEEVSTRAVQLNSGGEKLLMLVSWRIDDEQVCEIMNNDTGVRADQKVWLTTVDGTSTGTLDKKHNQPLARLLKAIDLNTKGKRWSGAMFIGRQARVVALSEDGTGDYEGRRFYRVKSAARL